MPPKPKGSEKKSGNEAANTKGSSTSKEKPNKKEPDTKADSQEQTAEDDTNKDQSRKSVKPNKSDTKESYIWNSLEANALHPRESDKEDGFYPLDLVPLFSVDGPNRRKPFTIERSYHRLVHEINRLIEIQQQPNCQFVIEKKGFSKKEIKQMFNKFNTKEFNNEYKDDRKVTRYPLCLFRDDLLSSDEHAITLLNKLIFHYTKEETMKKLKYESMSWSQSQPSDCTVLCLKVKRPRITPSIKNFLEPIGPIGSNPEICNTNEIQVTTNLLRLQYDTSLKESVENMFLDLMEHIEKILDLKKKEHEPPAGSSLKPVTFKIGKSTARPKHLIEFDICDIKTWDTTLMKSRFSNYKKKKQKKTDKTKADKTKTGKTKTDKTKTNKTTTDKAKTDKNETDIDETDIDVEICYDEVVVLCVLTPGMVPIDLHVTEKETEISIQEHFALALESALLKYFKENPISNSFSVAPKQTGTGRTNVDFENNMVLYLAYKFEHEEIEDTKSKVDQSKQL